MMILRAILPFLILGACTRDLSFIESRHYLAKTKESQCYEISRNGNLNQDITGIYCLHYRGSFDEFIEKAEEDLRTK